MWQLSPTKWKSLWWVTKIRKRASIHRILYCCPLLSYIFDLLGFQAATTLLFWAQVNRCFRIASKLPACCHTVVQNGTSKLQLALRLIQTSRPTRSSLPLELTELDGKFWRIHSKKWFNRQASLFPSLFWTKIDKMSFSHYQAYYHSILPIFVSKSSTIFIYEVNKKNCRKCKLQKNVSKKLWPTFESGGTESNRQKILIYVICKCCVASYIFCGGRACTWTSQFTV